jgi:hypothetical protein
MRCSRGTGTARRSPGAAVALAKCRQMRDRPGSDPVWAERVAATEAWMD